MQAGIKGDDVGIAEGQYRVGNCRYSVRLDARGALGITRWRGMPATPSWPVITDAVPEFATLEDGVCVPLPGVPWAAKALAQWAAIRDAMQRAQ